MYSLKGRSARQSNLILNRVGQFWEHESFDHVIRSGKFYKTVRYVLNNPVKAGLVNDWRDWPWNYCRRELSDKLLFVVGCETFNEDDKLKFVGHSTNDKLEFVGHPLYSRREHS
ncbi:MAG TPA: hypothetical protein VFH31_13160, partial [Pyrinomonadaceae bacterium]|nr:hypothetical protein [Pyrinomonadaceae bacterium]